MHDFLSFCCEVGVGREHSDYGNHGQRVGLDEYRKTNVIVLYKYKYKYNIEYNRNCCHVCCGSQILCLICINILIIVVTIMGLCQCL